MKGLLLLTEARSGSSWLGNAARRTGVLGKSGEWLSPGVLGVNAKQVNGEGLYPHSPGTCQYRQRCFLRKNFSAAPVLVPAPVWL